MSNRFTTSDGVAIAWYRWGESNPGPVVVLHHGFASSAASNWEAPGVVSALLQSGRSVLAVDARGHGAADKPHDADLYGEARMACDLVELLDELQLEQVDLFGYSMGAVVSLIAASTTTRVRRLIVGGVGEGVIESGGVDTRQVGREAIVQALLAESVATVAEPAAVGFRMFAEFSGADLKALAAQAQRLHCTAIALAGIRLPTLVLAGEDDPLALHPQRLAAAIPGASCTTLAGDHLTVMRNPALAETAVAFFNS
jgi:pimeloyl-ACP methyl ester carboxylesterase